MWHFAWCHERCWINLHTREGFTFARKHQWKYRERRFQNVQKVKNAFGNRMDGSCRMYVKSHWWLWITLAIVGRMFKRKDGPRNKGKGCGLQELNWIFLFFCQHQSIIQLYMQCGIICQSGFSRRRYQGKDMCRFSDWHIEKYEEWWRLWFYFWGS